MRKLTIPLRVSKLFTLVLIAAGCLIFFGTTAFAQEEPQEEPQAATETEVETGTITQTTTITEPGVLIVSVLPESAAAAAGIVRGDILLRVGDTEVNDAAALRAAITALDPDETVTLTVLHGDDERALDVTLGERDGNAFLGVTPYVERTARYIPLPPRDGEPGRPFLHPHAPWPEMMGPMTVTLTIAEVITDSPAADAGIQISDTIVAINGEALANPRALISGVNALAPGDTLTLTVQMPDGEEETIAIELGAHPDNEDRAYLGIRFTVAVQMDGPMGQGRMPRLRLFLPRFEERQQQRQEFERRFHWREDGQDAAPDGPMRWRLERDEQDFTLPLPGRFFRWEMHPADEDILIFRHVTPFLNTLPLIEEVDVTIIEDVI